jgi:hypothetical protein
MYNITTRGDQGIWLSSRNPSKNRSRYRSVDVSSSDIYDKDPEKCDDVRSISMMNMAVLDWFRPSHGVIALRPVFAIL